MQVRGSRTAVVSVLLVVGASGAGLGVACANGGSSATSTGDDASVVETGGGIGHDSSGGSSGGGCDANTSTDWTNCGSCGHQCATGQICNAGQCQDDCTSPQVVCQGTPGCFDLTKDLHNCGACGKQCLPPAGGTVPGTAVCSASQCGFSCPADAGVPDGGAPIAQCDVDSGGSAGCFDLTSTSDHCGACNKQCQSGQVCTQSTCCPQGSMVCGSGCIDVTKDPNNCGACDAGCPAPAQCSASKCIGYTTSTPTGVIFLDACALGPGSKTLANQGGGWVASPSLLTLPFTFTFYGTAETQYWLQNQGAMGIGPPMTGIFVPDSFPDCQGGGPDPSTGYPAIVAFGDSSLATGPNGVCTATTGTAPNRQFVATWSQTTDQSDPGSVLTFSIVLSETSNTIDLMYQTASGADGGLDPTVAGATATVGIQAKPAGTLVYTPWSCHTSFITRTPLDVRFTPAP
jgi:hypothetical protein